MYLMFLGPLQEGGDFRDEGIRGPGRFLDKVWSFVGDACREGDGPEIHHGVMAELHQTKKWVTKGWRSRATTPASLR